MDGANITNEDRDMHWVIKLTVIFGPLNLGWEVLQLPFYTLWNAGAPGEIAYAVIHCTGGDILIGAAVAMLVRVQRSRLPARFEEATGCSSHASSF